jgi:hypothetical protein
MTLGLAIVGYRKMGRLIAASGREQGFGVRGRPLLQPVDLHRIHALAAQG